MRPLLFSLNMFQGPSLPQSRSSLNSSLEHRNKQPLASLVEDLNSNLIHPGEVIKDYSVCDLNSPLPLFQVVHGNSNGKDPV